MTDEELVDRLNARDASAQNVFHHRFKDRIFAVARRIVRDDWDAEEVVQDVCWTVYRKIHLFNGKSAFWSWVYRITENAAKMKVRKYRRYPLPVDQDVLQAITHDASVESTSGRPDQQLHMKRCLEVMETFLAESDEVNRSVYVSMDIEGLTKEEAAEKLGMSIPALKARLHRVRYALKSELAEL